MNDILWGIGGILGLIAIGWAFSANRRAINWRTVLGALAIQMLFGFIVLGWSAGRQGLERFSNGVQGIINNAKEGIDFLFGNLTNGAAMDSVGFIFAFNVLPVIVFFSSLIAVLYYLGIMQWVIRLIGGALSRLLGTSEGESLSATANIFVGQTEAPLVIRPYLKGLTRSGLFAVMVGGLSTVAGSVLVGYSLLGAPLEYLIAASFMAAPGALLMAKLIVPEDPDEPPEEPFTKPRKKEAAGDGIPEDEGPHEGSAEKTLTRTVEDDEDELEGMEYRNVVDAAASGAGEGLKLALNIGAMLLAFISLIALINLLLGVAGGWFGNPDLTFEQILGYVFAPLMTAIGVPWAEATGAGSFVGQKVVVNEFVAFSDFAPVLEEFSPKTAAIITFALTGFANLGSLGILLGGLGSLVKHRRREIAELGIRAIAAGTLANLMSATIAGILIR